LALSGGERDREVGLLPGQRLGELESAHDRHKRPIDEVDALLAGDRERFPGPVAPRVTLSRSVRQSRPLQN